jgi:hypothetical protein
LEVEKNSDNIKKINMNLNINGTEYKLNINRAFELGVLTKVVQKTITLTQDEAAVLNKILNRVGGTTGENHPRGVADIVKSKLEAAFENQFDTELDLTIEEIYRAIYFKN